MPLSDTFAIKLSTPAPRPEKSIDGDGMYLHVSYTGKSWRLNYRFSGKQKTLALSVYPAVSLFAVRMKREAAGELLAASTDLSAPKREEKRVATRTSVDTLQAIRRE